MNADAPSPEIAVVISTHRPHAGRLARTLAGLRAQTLAPAHWELVLVDNASQPPVDPAALAESAPSHLRLVVESTLGLTAARRAGVRSTQAPLIVMVDDDNVLAPDYLARVAGHFAAQPRIGALGGRSRPEFERAPPDWAREFDDLIACRDLGDQPLVGDGHPPPGDPRQIAYPRFAPIGAGLAIRRVALRRWLDDAAPGSLSDRRGQDLSSSGDNDIILHLLRDGWQVGYFPDLQLTHLIPSTRTAADYLARLNRGIQRSWMQVLARHGASPWGPLSRSGARFRMIKAWFTYRAWQGPVQQIRWQGACGHFEGRVPYSPRALESAR
ncbi:MAG: glycosyltransferase family 2 protein [Verrucomicrobia bacterium]|nr:glycosyltransferase family 2 protein [Verrucomicrobiota bacterium]